MSYNIKPEDVPDTLAIEIQDNLSGVTIHAYRYNIAAILTEAIDAGLVSPPCFCVRQNGELRKFDSGEIKVFSGKPWAHDTEHYKGQTS